MADDSPSFVRALCAGGAAGFAVDISLFPIDTVKTRLQAPGGFRSAGGFTGIYRGLGAAAAGSVPGAALFFTAYEQTKHALGAENTSAQVCAASVGETVACSVRVPVENVKQNQQTGKIDARLLHGAAAIFREVVAKLQFALQFGDGPAGLAEVVRTREHSARRSSRGTQELPKLRTPLWVHPGRGLVEE